ncbi:hypothetical protein BGZ91_010406 [Linnemannia elongata]|nr:hypothetical protein BGZ91_010406 [Linnemannia elongata]
MYRLCDGDAVVQRLDGIITKQDRCIVFPNIYQRQVQPFELQDPTRPGSRKILVFFLVNPEEAEWHPVIETLQEIEPRLPLEIGQMISELSDRSKLMGLEEAKKYREELMKERKFFVQTTNDELLARPFSFCEH